MRPPVTATPQAAAPVPTAWQETLPSAFTTRTAVPAAHVPVTRFCNAVLSSPSSRTAFRLPAVVCEVTVDGFTPALTKNPPADPPPVFVNTLGVALLALFTASPDVLAAAFVFVTCNWIPGEGPVSVVFAST